MTNKEQIMINGVDVSGCEYACNTAFGKNGCKHPMMKNIYCSKNPNCYFKQLARKTQECEELRSECGELFNAKLEILRDLDHYKRAYYGCSKRIEEHLVIRAPLPPPEFVDSRYRKALEEIEKQCKCYGRSKYTQEFDREYGGELDTNILDIITKAKDGNNEQL